jgi:hypothetical protein
MNVDRERDRDADDVLDEAEAVRSQLRQLVLLDMRVWRHLQPREMRAFQRLLARFIRRE